jgi:hypothetical protein
MSGIPHNEYVSSSKPNELAASRRVELIEACFRFNALAVPRLLANVG